MAGRSRYIENEIILCTYIAVRTRLHQRRAKPFPVRSIPAGGGQHRTAHGLRRPARRGVTAVRQLRGSGWANDLGVDARQDTVTAALSWAVDRSQVINPSPLPNAARRWFAGINSSLTRVLCDNASNPASMRPGTYTGIDLMIRFSRADDSAASIQPGSFAGINAVRIPSPYIARTCSMLQ